MTVNDDQAAEPYTPDPWGTQPAAEHHAEPYVLPRLPTERIPTEDEFAEYQTATGAGPEWMKRIRDYYQRTYAAPVGDDNCGDPECLCPPAPALSPEPPTVTRRRRRVDPAAVLAVVLAGVQVGRAVRNLVETIRAVQEVGGL